MNTDRYGQDELSSVVIHSETATKNKKSLREIIILMRPWIFVFIFLIITEIFLRFSVPSWMIFNKNIQNCQTYYEFLQTLGTKHNISHFKLFLEIIQKKDPNTFKIYFLGDSIVLGNAPFKLDSNEKRDDIALSLEKELQIKLLNKNIRVYNLANLGAGEYYNYEMIQVLVKFKPKFVIKNVNFRNFNDFISNPQPQPQPQTTKPVSENKNIKVTNIKQTNKSNLRNKINTFLALWNSFNNRPIGQRAELIGSTFENFLYNNFMLYCSRDYLSFLIFKGPKNEELENLSDKFKETKKDKVIDKNVIHLQDKIQFERMIRLHYNFPKLTFINRPLIFSSKIIEFLSSRKIPTFFFMSAINHELIDGFIDNPNIFKANMEIIDSIFKGNNIYYCNFNNALTQENFRDSDHLNAKGNQNLAELIAAEILPIIEKIIQEG